MSNRSGSAYSVPRDANRVPFLVAASTADGITPVVLEADPTTHQLQVSSSGGGGGTQYAEGATTSPATGNVALGRYSSSTPSLSSNQLESLQLDSSGNLKVKLSGDTTATGTISGSGQSVTIATNGQTSVGIQVSGTFSGTILIKGSVDGTTYTPTSAVALTSGAISTTITAAYTGQANAGGLVSFQLTAITWASGNASVTLVASVANSTVMLDNPLPIGTNSIGSVGLNAGTNAIGSVSSSTTTGSAVPTTAHYVGIKNAAGNLAGLSSADNTGDNGGASILGQVAYNGTAWDRIRTANAAAATTGTGLLGVGSLIFDGTNWQRQTSTTNIGNVGLNAGSNTIGKIQIDQTTPTVTNGVWVNNTAVPASTPTSTQNIGQTTSNSTQVQLTASSLVPTNGVTVQALSANTAKIYVGLTGVTTSTGFELNPGQQQQFSPANANLLYIIGSNNTDKVCWLVA